MKQSFLGSSLESFLKVEKRPSEKIRRATRVTTKRKANAFRRKLN